MPALSGDDHAFFDMENCSMCVNFTTDPTLMPNLGWEHHNVAEGMLSITTFKTEAAEVAYQEAISNMEANGAKLMAGEDLPLCGFCQSMMGLMMEGARHEVVPFEGGTVAMMTSTDPETVKHIHLHCDTINEELEKMQAPMEG